VIDSSNLVFFITSDDVNSKTELSFWVVNYNTNSYSSSNAYYKYIHTTFITSYVYSYLNISGTNIFSLLFIENNAGTYNLCYRFYTVNLGVFTYYDDGILLTLSSIAKINYITVIENYLIVSADKWTKSFKVTSLSNSSSTLLQWGRVTHSLTTYDMLFIKYSGNIYNSYMFIVDNSSAMAVKSKSCLLYKSYDTDGSFDILCKSQCDTDQIEYLYSCFTCPPNKPFFDPSLYICVSQCSSANKYGNSSTRICQTSCPPTMNLMDNYFVCYSSCPVYEYENTCISSCPEYTIPDSAGLTCYTCTSLSKVYFYGQCFLLSELPTQTIQVNTEYSVYLTCIDAGMYVLNDSCVSLCPENYTPNISHLCQSNNLFISPSDIPVPTTSTTISVPIVIPPQVSSTPTNTNNNDTPTPTSVRKCPDNLFYFVNACIDTCPDNTMVDWITLTCIRCSSNNKFLYKNNCLFKCPANSVVDTKNGVCFRCSDGNSFFYKQSCISYCPPNTQIDLVNKICCKIFLKL
jgi:hypothetical protein